MSPTAACCRAMFFRAAPDLPTFRAEVRKAFFWALKGDRFGVEVLRLAAMLSPLPAAVEDWPEEARVAIASEGLGTALRFSCGALGSDGRCTIYDRRPRICSDFRPSPSACGACTSGCSAPCADPEKEAQLMPAKEPPCPSL